MYVDGEPFFYCGFIWRYPQIPLEVLKEYGFNAADASGHPSRGKNMTARPNWAST